MALACALPTRLPDAARIAEACHRSGVPVLVGGRGFGVDGRWARRLGLPWAGDGRAAAVLLADEDADLRERFPLRDYTTGQLDATVADLGYIVDFLTAAVYVDDPELFTGFIEWLVEILSSRRVPHRGDSR